jgi:nucleoside phosphorylase
VARVARTASEKAILRRTGASVVEMEAAGALGAAARLGIPGFCVRSVTDLAGESFAVDYGATLSADGRFIISRILRDALRHPLAAFPELLRLQYRCRIASRNLGVFLAACRF